MAIQFLLFLLPGVTVEDVKRCLGYHLDANIAYKSIDSNINIDGGKCEKIHVKDNCKYILILRYIFCFEKIVNNCFPFYNQ